MNKFVDLHALLSDSCLEFFNRWYWRFQCESDYTYYDYEKEESLETFKYLTTSSQRGVIFDFFDFSGMILDYDYIRQLGIYQITVLDKKTDLHLINSLEYKGLETIDAAAIKLIELANNLYNNNFNAMHKVCKHKLLINVENGTKDCIICGERFDLYC